MGPVYEARFDLAKMYGEARGWCVSRTPFGLVTLAAGKAHAGSRGYWEDVPIDAMPDMFDHAYFYRCKNRFMLDRRVCDDPVQ